MTLRGMRPPVWQRLEVTSGITLLELHGVLQAAMGWTDSHLHEFEHGGECYGSPDRESGTPMRSERTTILSALLRKPKDRLRYVYDFGDDWQHEIVLEHVAPAEEGVVYPRVTAGRRACPPEDVGGIGGYMFILRVMQDSSHPEYASTREWLGEDFDPEWFDAVASTGVLPHRRATG